ncbi:MAG: formylglycine-generating enzyme family protein [Candidatus Latescibacterota bacterium]|jgi:formylglycine-generating enzyme required for sulfatase activity
MKRLASASLVLLWVSVAYANPETTVDLPGGATMDFVWIEPGTFTMGSLDPELGRQYDVWPPRQVTITHGFWLGKYEVTQEQWSSVMGSSPWLAMKRPPATSDCPATVISWIDAQAFAQRLNEHFGELAYRLPTEAEWEYACRAGTTTRWSFGDDESLLSSYAWYGTDYMAAQVQPVGGKLPNPWGLFDMHGNAWEWVHDWYSYSDPTSAPLTDPSGPPTGYDRLERGGACYSSAVGTSSAISSGYGSPAARRGHDGFRLLKGTPLTLTIPEGAPFPHSDAGRFFPADEGNIWILASHNYGYGPPSADTTALVLESRMIEDQQYWEMRFLGGPFRLDERGNLWFRQGAPTWLSVRDFLQALVDNPALCGSQYYQQSAAFRGLRPDQPDLLLFEFDGPVLDPASATYDLDCYVFACYREVLKATLDQAVRKMDIPAPNQRSFVLCYPGDGGETEIVFERGVGPVKMTLSYELAWEGHTESHLIWARLDGREYGLHPGPGYPGYRAVPSSVTKRPWGEVKQGRTISPGSPVPE